MAMGLLPVMSAVFLKAIILVKRDIKEKKFWDASATLSGKSVSGVYIYVNWTEQKCWECYYFHTHSF
jgi:hypothetical protein